MTRNLDLVQALAFVFQCVLYSRDISTETYRCLRARSFPGWVKLAPQHRYKVDFRFPSSRSLFRRDSISGPGATIPQELFDSILHHAGSDWRNKTRKRLTWQPSLGSIEDSLHTLKMCSLVCRHWANLCRRHIFSGATLVVSSHGAVETLLAYGTSPQYSILPLQELVKAIDVKQAYCISRLSFCHLLSHPRFTSKLCRLHIVGPIPWDFPRFFRRDSPHWSLPPTIITPPSLLKYQYIHVTDVHLPTFAHATKYVGHFAHAGEQRFDKWTWDMDGPEETLSSHFPRLRARSAAQRDRSYLHIRASNCKNNVGLCFAAAMTHPGFLLCALSREDYQQIYRWATSREWGFKQSDLSYCIFSIGTINYYGAASHLHTNEIPSELITPKSNLVKVASFCQDSCSGAAALRLFGTYENLQETGSGTAQVELVGVHACFTQADVAIRDSLLQPLMARLEHFPSLRTIVLEFEDYGSLQAALLPHYPLPQIHGQRYSFVHRYQTSRLPGKKLKKVLSCSESPNGMDRKGDRYDWLIGIDPLTLVPTGEYFSLASRSIYVLRS